jgi:tripartite-type tricarboxylate transporter receptor subunit TctC
MQVQHSKWASALRSAAGVTAMALLACTAHAQSYPSKPVTLIVPFPPGGASDTQFRALATAAGKDLKQAFVVVNQPGVAGTMAPATMARSAAPDGYTISVVFSSLFRLPHVQKVNYDPTQDFTYIAGISKFIYGLVVAADSPYKTAVDLTAAAKAKPGQLNFGAISIGSSGHTALMRWARAADFKPNFVPYKGSAEVMQAVLGHHVEAMTEASWGPLVQQGRVHALMVFEEQRIKQFSEVPTAKELGWNVIANAVVGLAGPKGMDPAIVKTLQDAFHKATSDPAFLKTLEVAGQSVAYLDSAEFTKLANDLYRQEKRNIDDLKAAGVSLTN